MDHMANIQTIQSIPVNVTVLDAAYSQVSFTLPTEHIRAFMYMFESMAQLMKSIQWKIKTNETLIHARNEIKEKEAEARYQAYENATMETYKNLVEQGNTPREALSLTVSKMNEKFAFSSYDQCKKLLTKNKLLKNTGFYGSRHKFT